MTLFWRLTMKIVKRNKKTNYPSLSDFTCNRRNFLKKLAHGTLVLGMGSSLIACSGNAEDPDPNTDTGKPDAGVDVNETNVEPEVLVDTEEEMPYAGGIMEPHYFEVRLPEEHFWYIFISDSDYLSYGITFVTYDEYFAEYFRQNPQLSMEIASDALLNKLCEDFETQEGIQQAQQELIAALETHYNSVNSMGNQNWIESLTLLIDFCESNMMIDGDIAEPEYP